MLVIRRRWTVREVKTIFSDSINLSMYICATTKHEGLHLEYLKIRSTYCWMVSVGGLEPWKTVGISLVCVVCNHVSFSSTAFWRSEESKDRTLGFPVRPSRPRIMSKFEPKMSFSKVKASVSKKGCKRIKIVASNLANKLKNYKWWTYRVTN